MGRNIARTILHLIDRAGVTLNIGHITLDNTENNAVAMRELEALLAARETNIEIDFDHLNHRIRCYAHIVNICSSHVVASVTSTSKSYLTDLGVTPDTHHPVCDESDDESDDGDTNLHREIDELDLADGYDDSHDSKLKSWVAGIKRDPIRRARRVVCLLRSSDLHREDFLTVISDGNERGWFTRKIDGERTPVQIPELQLLSSVGEVWSETDPNQV
ncbi:hypothetical protein EDB85DRAFT_2156753 [Lactarius pseudohatsudake]|nr:hypothetical protein EDB85DRAFT_2156753 [Lactarius pseudohatsudake]